MSQFAADLKALFARVKILEQPTGGQTYNTVQKLKQLVDNLAAQVAGLASSGVVWAGPVDDPTGIGLSTSGRVTAAAGITSAGVQANDLSSAGGGSRAVYVNNTSKQLGFLTSSRRFKQDITRASTTLEVLRAIHVYYFRYREAVEQHPDDAYLWIGAMAEDLDAAGFTQLVDYEDGEPFGLQQQLMWVIPFMYAELLDEAMQDHEARLKALENR
ncbi:tail fiber domain-containing protein [Pseudolysinimonas kribbensis]|nr:tail fiber domain-containing protein [Pseudolysinimonas kribbensis]